MSIAEDTWNLTNKGKLSIGVQQLIIEEPEKGKTILDKKPKKNNYIWSK